jgi:hypothetical protein
MIELALRDTRAPSRPPVGPQRPPVLGEECMTSQGIALTWAGTHWRPPEAQFFSVLTAANNPHIHFPSDNTSTSLLPPGPGDLWWDGAGAQLYCWHVDTTGLGQWVNVGNDSDQATVASDGISIIGDGSQASPIRADLIAGVEY